MSRRSDSRHSSPLSVRSSAASVTEPSDRLLRSECRRQGGKHCGHVECQVRSSLSRRSGGHQHDHAAPSQTATPSSLSPTLSTVSSSSQEEEDEELQEEDVDQQLVASESSSKIGSFRRMLSGGFSSLLWSSNSNNSNKRQTVEAEDERDIDEAQLSDADDLVMEKGSIEARLGTKDNLMPAFSDQLASAAAEDAAGGVAMETRARRKSLIRRATHPLLWLLGAIYYFAKLTLNRTANKLSNTAKHTVAIVTSGIALLLNSARAASCRLATGIGQVGGGIRRGFANGFAMTVGSVASMLRYANRATVVATASTKSIAGWVLQYSASAVRTLVLTTRERTYRSFVLISPSRNRRFSCLCFLVLLLLLLLIVIGLLLWLVPTSSGYYSKLSPPLAVEQSAAARSADSTEALSASVSSKLASVTSQVDSIAQRLSRQSDETAATVDAAAAASAAAVAAVNQSESARRLELASLRADLSRLANQHRRYFITVWNRVQLLSESNAELFTRKDSDFKQQQEQQKQLADIEELRKSVLEFQTRLNRLESVQASISTGSSSMSGLLDSKSARCQSPADELADFALHTAGGYVVSIRCTKAYTVKRSYFHLFGVPVFSYSNGPNVALQPGLQLGECWPFLGFPGHVIVRLAAPARVSHVTIDHVPRSLTYNGSADSAPKNFSIYGLVNEQDSFQEAQLLGDFSYDADKGPSSQTFAIPADSPHRDRVYPAVELVIRSNHGAEHTCLYRFRVHGSLV
uniref:SUN domain-containing protein n=1 Tax=Macrostomum lignano TaxID=282301 RepID=A0A1I8GYM9_9PLAT